MHRTANARHRDFRSSAMAGRRSRTARNGSAEPKESSYSADQDWIMIPSFTAGAFLCIGLTLLFTEASRDPPIPDLDEHYNFVSEGGETTCRVRADPDAEPRCHFLHNHTEYLDTELYCYCPGFAWAKDSEAEQRIETFAGPDRSYKRDRKAWCAMTFAAPLPNIITYENVADLHWACGVILDDDRKPCHLSTATRSHSRCSAGVLYPGTRKHHRCLEDLLVGADLPCTRLEDGRLLIGQQRALVEQLGQHQADFDESKTTMLRIASGLTLFGVLVATAGGGVYFWNSKVAQRRRVSSGPVGASKVGRPYESCDYDD